MKRKIIICKGLPASGKTTWSKQFCKDNPDFVRINRDDLRELLGNPTWTREFEDEVTDIERRMGLAILHTGKSLVVDDSNLARKHQNYWEVIGAVEGYEVLYQTFDLPVEDCIKRDLMRPNPVGRAAIEHMYKTYVNIET